MKVLFYLTLTIVLISCSESPTDYAFKWSREIKSKILKDVNIATDSISVDTSKGNLKEVTFYSKGVRSKYFGVRQSTGDTLVSIFYSRDQDFEIVRELCPGIERSFEGIRYKGKHMGLSEFRYCNGKLKLQGFRVDDNVGIWKEWNENGKLIKETEFGGTEKLNELKTIKYYR
jgi:hypothetical protein